MTGESTGSRYVVKPGVAYFLAVTGSSIRLGDIRSEAWYKERSLGIMFGDYRLGWMFYVSIHLGDES